MAKVEPLLTSERITNDDGTASDYLVRYLQKMYAGGAQSVKFPVTSVNGKTGDVVITFDDIVEAGGIDYDKLNEKLQELIAGLAGVRTEIYTAIANLKNEDDPFDQYAFRTGFNYANDVADILSYEGNDLLNDYGRCGLYAPHWVDGVTTNAYPADYTLDANGNTLQCYLFAMPRKFLAERIIFRIATTNNLNDVAGAKQLWQIGIYKATKKLITTTGALGVPDVDQYFRFPGARVWMSPVMDTSVKFDSVTPSNSTYVNQFYYDYNGYTKMPPSLVFDSQKTIAPGVYFVVVARQNSATPPAQSNQIHWTGTKTYSSGYGQDTGNFINMFPANVDGNWYANGMYLSSASGYMKNPVSWTTYTIKGLSAEYINLPDNLEWVFRNTDLTFSTIAMQTNTFTDPLDNSHTSCELYFKGSFFDTNIGAPIFNGTFL